MAPIILYVLLISCLLGGLASVIDYALEGTRVSRRIAWIAAMLLSVFWPLQSMLTADTDSVRVAATAMELPERDIEAEPSAPGRGSPASVAQDAEPVANGIGWAFLDRMQPAVPETRSTLNSILLWCWIGSSVLALLFYLLCATNLYLASRYWQPETVDDRDVLVSEHIGPAMYGLLRPRIVVPKWLLGTPTSVQRLVVRHEQSHIAGRDQWLLYTAILLVTLMPWNPVIWWQLARLRDAIESDCDARVLADESDTIAYAEALLTVGQQRSVSPMMSVALVEPVSRLEIRIRRLLKPVPVSRGAVTAAALLTPVLVAAAIAVESPGLQFSEVSSLPEESIEGDEMNSRNLLPALLAAGLVQAGPVDPNIPEGWQIMGGGGPDNLPRLCDVGVDAELGPGNVTVQCEQPVSVPAFGGMMQRFQAAEFLGKRIRFSANVRSEAIRDVDPLEDAIGFVFQTVIDPSQADPDRGAGVGSIWLRVEEGNVPLVIDNGRDRGLRGTNGWTYQEMVVDVPENANGIWIGFWMQGKGQIWMADPRFEVVGTNVPVTAEPIQRNFAPRNLNLQ